LPKPKLENV